MGTKKNLGKWFLKNLSFVRHKDGQHGQKTHFWTIFTFTFGQREKTLQKLIKTLVRVNLKHNNREFIRNGNDWYMFWMTWLSWQLK